MGISSAAYTETGDIKVAFDNGTSATVPAEDGNRHYKMVLEWGGTIAAYAAPPPQTDEEAFQELMKNKHLKALFVAIGKRAGFTGIPQIITAYKAEL